MTKNEWRRLLKRLDTEERMGKLTPVSPAVIAAFETKRGIKLPRSYRGYCEVFGAGEFARQFKIAVPGFKGKAKTYGLEYLDKMAHEGLEYRAYSKDPSQHERGIFFCIDILRSYHFFDPEDVTDTVRSEYAVYTLFDDFTVKRMADSFGEFVVEFCLGPKHKRLIKSPPPDQVFMPVTV